MLKKSYFYGPVPSRRLGFSLGVDLLPRKICSFNCLYCQLGQTKEKTARRLSYINFSKLKKDLKTIIKRHTRIDYITISGSGEPTLHKDLDKIITIIKKITHNKYPVAVITNSSLLYRKKVREELSKADLIVPSLDAETVKTFNRINHPFKGITLKKVIQGLIQLRQEFKGKIWLEVMLIAGINDSKQQAEKFKKIIDKINPDEIQLNLPIRPSGVKLSLPSRKTIEMVSKILGKNAKAVVKFSIKKKGGKAYGNLKKDIFNFLKVRPATLEDLTSSLNANSTEIVKQLYWFLERKKIKESRSKGTKYFVIND